MSHDGLEKVKTKTADLVYARPGVTLAGYTKVMLGPIDVAFSKDWDPRRLGTSVRITSADRDAMRSKVATLVRDEFVKTLGAKGGYPVVETEGPDVLRLKASIINLYVTAPDAGSSPMTRTYVRSAGEMTLVLEVFDSETGQILARVADRQVSDMQGRIGWSNRVMNTGEGELIAAGWASSLRKALDKANGIGKK